MTAEPVRRTWRACRSAFFALAALSALINLLMLTAPIYMLQVFDRVLTSRSLDTLLALSVMAVLAVLVLASLEAVRSFSLASLGTWLERQLGEVSFRAGLLQAANAEQGSKARCLSDLGTIKAFLTGPGVVPIMDAPWTPIFLVVIFMLHPALGVLATLGATVLLGLALANEYYTRAGTAKSSEAQARARTLAESAAQNADVVRSLGMTSALQQRWFDVNREATRYGQLTAQLGGLCSASAKFIRLGLQLAMLGAGAWLVIDAQLTPGAMLASTILLGRALAPVDQAISAWKGFVTARGCYHSLNQALGTMEASHADSMPLPRPEGALRCEDVSYQHDGREHLTLRDVGFHLTPGKVLGIIGPSGAGKTTLARLLVGIEAPRLGHVRLDGMELAQWDSDDRGQYIGYLPQHAELFSGTIKDNIARFTGAGTDAVIEAAKLAGAHDIIMRMPQGYDTQVGQRGSALAGGQRQRIALARALFGSPALVVMDEPNANLDQLGTEALLETLAKLKARGVTLVMVAHEPSVLRQVDYLLVLAEGSVRLRGPRDEVLARVVGPRSARTTSADTGEGSPLTQSGPVPAEIGA